MREYLKEPIVGIIAPAGYGKTEEIANAVMCCEGKQLILTHTRAGVSALQTRMKKKNIANDKFEIDTIASFCLKWCKAYPKTAVVNIPEKSSAINYSDIYRGTKRIFSYKWAKDIIHQSYKGLFIDEYQDCTQLQHTIFMGLVNVLPIRIFGDPLQGIFYWSKEDTIVNWHNFTFKIIHPLTKAWRWENSNQRLGIILTALRKYLENALDGYPVKINIRNFPGCITVLNSAQWNNGMHAYKISNYYKNIVYLSSFLRREREFARNNGGYFQCDEVKDLREVEEIIEKIEEKNNEEKTLELIKSLKNMINHISAELNSYIENLKKGKSNFSRIKKHKELGHLLENVCKENSSKAVLEILIWFIKGKKFKIYRQEMMYRIKSIYEYMAKENVSLYEAVDTLNNQQYFNTQRYDFPRLSSRTVLTKGLEFDCVIIDARNEMDVRDFYVAMTRAKKHIYIITDDNELFFKEIKY